MAHVIRGERSLSSEVLAVLGDQHETRIGSIVDRFRPNVAYTVSKIVGEPFVHIDQQSVVLRIPTGGVFKIDRDRESPHTGIKRTGWLRAPSGREERAVFVFCTAATLRVVSGNNLLYIRLVHVEETSQMYSANMKSANADRCVFEGFELHRQACLDAVGILVVLNESHDDRRSKERAISDRRAARKTCKWIAWIVRISPILKEALQRCRRNSRPTGKRKKFRLGVETVFKRAARIFPVVELRDVARAPARWLLTGQQWSRNYAVKEPEPGSNHEIMFCTDVVGHTEPRVKILPLSVENI